MSKQSTGIYGRSMKSPSITNTQSRLTVDDQDARRIERLRQSRMQLSSQMTKMHLGSPAEKRVIKASFDAGLRSQLAEKQRIQQSQKKHDEMMFQRDREYQMKQAGAEEQRAQMRRELVRQCQSENKMIIEAKRRAAQEARQLERQTGPSSSSFFDSFGTSIP